MITFVAVGIFAAELGAKLVLLTQRFFKFMALKPPFTA
jgi:hypothetical protein